MDVASLYERAKRAWPQLNVPEQAFVDAVCRREPESQKVTDLGELRHEDLYLAVACSAGVAGATAELEKNCIAPALATLAQRERDESVLEEIAQALRVRLLVGDDTRPARIVEYRGQGALRSWVRVIAVRLHADYYRRRAVDGAKETNLDEQGELAALTMGVDMTVIRETHRAVVDRILRKTLSMLSRRDRTLLRLAYAEGVSLTRIGTMYGVDKATVSRWLSAIRGRVADETMAQIADEIGSSTDEARSLFALLASSLDLSMSSILGSAVAGAP